ncbi:hypothetical protein E2C01_012960 [Portunus trituberculatus]|uniref:Uncharacterized protein n=1 Tax=Portunus trituberculatus TaxID=210409 RepID=A0A5B7DF87_PORTR|nr:hypothetical protein [Portunus trituberculatus]
MHISPVLASPSPAGCAFSLSPPGNPNGPQICEVFSSFRLAFNKYTYIMHSIIKQELDSSVAVALNNGLLSP